MKKQDLLVSLTIDHNLAGKALHWNTSFYLAQCSSIRYDHVILGKDDKGKGKGKTCVKRVKGGNCSTEEQDVKESMDKPRAFVAFGKVFFLCDANDMEYERWAFAVKISLGVSPIDKIMTPSWFINFIWNTFFQNNSVAFWDF